MITRRSFFTGLAAALVAQAVVRSGVLMPLRGIVLPIKSAFDYSSLRYDLAEFVSYLRDRDGNLLLLTPYQDALLSRSLPA